MIRRHPDGEPTTRLGQALDLAGLLPIIAILRAWDWACQRANHHHAHTPLDVLEETR